MMRQLLLLGASVVSYSNVYAENVYPFQQYGEMRRAYKEYVAEKNATKPSPAVNNKRSPNSGITVFGKKFRSYAEWKSSPEYNKFLEIRSINKEKETFAEAIDKEIYDVNNRILKRYNKNRGNYDLYTPSRRAAKILVDMKDKK